MKPKPNVNIPTQITQSKQISDQNSKLRNFISDQLKNFDSEILTELDFLITSSNQKVKQDIKKRTVKVNDYRSDLTSINKDLLLKLQETQVQTLLSTIRGKEPVDLPEKLYKLKLEELKSKVQDIS